MQEGPSRFDYNALATWLCRFHNVSDVRFIQPFGVGVVQAWTIPRKTVLGVNFKPNAPDGDGIQRALISTESARGSFQPKEPFVHPVKNEPMIHDMESVAIYNVTCRRYSLKPRVCSEQELNGIRYAVRMNFYNEHMARLQETKEQDKMYQAAGAVRGAFAMLTPTFEEESRDINEVPMPELPFGIQNEQFIKTMMLIDETNLMNGIVKIPHEVCVAARLPVWTGKAPEPDARMLEKLMISMKIDTSTEQGKAQRQAYVHEQQEEFMEDAKDKAKSEYFYAVPRKHVLAWPYHSEAYLAQFEERVERFRFIHADTQKLKLLYFLVPATMLEAGIKFFSESFLHKVDRRPITSVGFEFVPNGTKSTSVVDITMRSYFTYYSVPVLAPGTIKCLAPTLSKDFPLVHNWSEDEIARQISIEQHQYEQEHKDPKRITKK